MFEDQVLIEVVDDDYRAVPPGEPGSRLLVTSLFNRTQPLIRYELNAVLAGADGRQACGEIETGLRAALAKRGVQVPRILVESVAEIPRHRAPASTR